jgi:hypothetical protein
MPEFDGAAHVDTCAGIIIGSPALVRDYANLPRSGRPDMSRFRRGHHATCRLEPFAEYPTDSAGSAFS